MFDVLCVLAEVWYTCAEVLDIGAGDQEDHAVLLCNYLLALEAQVTITHLLHSAWAL